LSAQFRGTKAHELTDTSRRNWQSFQRGGGKKRFELYWAPKWEAVEPRGGGSGKNRALKKPADVRRGELASEAFRRMHREGKTELVTRWENIQKNGGKCRKAKSELRMESNKGRE